MRVRWALEEVGQPYDVRLVSFAAMKQPAHLALQPFGQIPTYEDGDLALFESGAIVLHIAERHPGLLPDDAERPGARDRLDVRRAEHGRAADRRARGRHAAGDATSPGTHERLPIVEDRIRDRLKLSFPRRLGDADWLDGAFSAGDLLMVNVLRRPAASGLLGDFPNLAAYVARGEARPAFKRAFDAQLAVFEASRQPAH